MTEPCQYCGGSPRADGCCILCAHARPGRRVQHVEKPPACPDCALRLAAIPGEIAEAFSLIPWLLLPRSGKAGEVRARDPDPPMPLTDVHDLVDFRPPPLGPYRQARLAEYPQDQVGRPSVAGVLWRHVRIWIDLRGMGEAGPAPTVPKLCDWLATRTPWAIERHPAVDEYAADVADLRGLLLALAGRSESDEKPVPLPGVPCVRCRHISLSRDHEGVVRCSWPDCMGVWRPEEYDRVSKATAAAVRRGQIKREDVASWPAT